MNKMTSALFRLRSRQFVTHLKGTRKLLHMRRQMQTSKQCGQNNIVVNFETGKIDCLRLFCMQGFFWVANRPEVVWEWSTAGGSRRFAPYGRWMDPTADAKSGLDTSPNLNLKPDTERKSGSENVKHSGEAMAGSAERIQRLVFIGIDLPKVRDPTGTPG